MINLTLLAYSVLAPISVVSEILMIYGFIRLNQIKQHPEIMIFWQCLSQFILDIHWFTGISTVKENLGDRGCQFIGAFCVYFYFLSWDYNLLLSIEILLKITQPHKTNYSRRMVWYHVVAHLSSLVFFILIIIGSTNGTSVMKTCFIEGKTNIELVVFIPAAFHFPLCAGIVIYTLWISFNKFYIQYLKYHMFVVGTFAFSWLPIAFVHFLNFKDFDVNIPSWFFFVNFI